MSLYNDERPKEFKNVLGQELIVRQMMRKISEGRFPHTALLTGPRGTGKTTCAGIIGKALNCDNLKEDGEPCCQCESCRSIEKGMSPSVLELDAATHNGVEDVRTLIEQSHFVPAGKKKVFILDEVHMFSTSAWNALLKTLEDPPENVIFIMATTELQKVPLTVLSRAVKFEFQKIKREVMQNYIYDLCVKYRIGIEPGALSLIVTSAEGCMRDALSLLEQFIGCEELETETVREFLGIISEEVIFDMLESMKDGDEAKALRIVEECEMRGKNMVLVVKAILEALTHATAYKASGTLPALSDVYRSRLTDFAESISEPRIGQFCGTFLQVYPMLVKNAQLSFFLKAAIVNLISSESLLSRLEREVSNLKGGSHSTGQVEVTAPIQMLEDNTLPGTDRGNPGIGDTDRMFPENGGTAGCMEGERVADEGAFEKLPEFEDYEGDSQETDFDGDQEGKSLEDAGEGTLEINDVSGTQKGQVIDVDELFRMMEGTCSSVANDGSSTDNIVPFNAQRKEEPADQRYVTEGEDDIFATFECYMAGGSARR